MRAMATMRDRRTGWIGLAAGACAVLIVIALAASAPGRIPPSATASQAPPTPPPAVGPVVFYEVLDAAGSHLIERHLDGVSLAREVGLRTDVDYGRTWAVDPTGTLAIAAIPAADDQAIEAISVADGAPLWSIRTPPAALDNVAWTADGSRLAITSVGTDTAPRDLLVIDAGNGRLTRITIPDDALVQGFDASGALFLRQQVPSPQGVAISWRFLRIDPATFAIQTLAGLPDIGPASDFSEDVDPHAGVAVDTTLGPGDQGTSIRVWPLGGGPSRVLTTLPSIDRLAIDPAGTGVAVSAAQTIRFIAFDGRGSDVFSGPDPIADFSWSERGDFLAVSTDRRGPNLTVVERATGTVVELPHADAVAQLLLVRMIGGVPLPAPPLPAVEPTPAPTAAPAGADAPGFPGFLSGWVETTGTTRFAHVQRLVPTDGGGLRVVADMPALDLGPAPVPDDGGPELRLLPRPGSTDVLVWIGSTERSQGWLWNAANGLRPLVLPADWPASAYDIAWRPDGAAIAASAGRANAAGDFEGIFVIAEPNGRTTTVVPVVGDYDRLEGWWSASELKVGHGICTEGCKGRYAFSARLRVRDHHLTQMTAEDRGHGSIDEWILDPSANTIVLSVINDDPRDDIAITWPASLGSVADLDVIGTPDGRSLVVAQATADGTDVYRINDPVGRAVGGTLANPEPIRLARIEGRSLRIDVSPDLGWALVTDRVDNVRLVRMADGRSWPADRERTMTWSTPAPG